jgi:hypothetical protein
MTMLNWRKRSSADKANSERVTPERSDTEQTDTEQGETEETGKVQHDVEPAKAENTRVENAGAENTEAEDAETAAVKTEDAEDTAADPADAETQTSRGRRRRSRARVRVGLPLLIGLVVLAVLLGAGVVWLLNKAGELRAPDLKASDSAAQQAVHAASQAARDLSSYDYRTLESDFKTASSQTTGSLHSEYDALAQQIRATAIQQQAVSQTVVIKAGVEDATPTLAHVIVFANRNATTTANPNRLPEPLRIRMTMVKIGDRWLAKDLQVL